MISGLCDVGFMTNQNFIFFLIGKRNLSNMDTGIYDIDYRGPKTHPHVPALNRSTGRHNDCKSNGLKS